LFFVVEKEKYFYAVKKFFFMVFVDFVVFKVFICLNLVGETY